GRRRHGVAGRAELRLREPARRYGGGDGRWPHRSPRLDGRARRRRGAAGEPARSFPGSASMSAAVTTSATLRQRMPLLLAPLLALAALPLVGSRSSWATLTVAGLAMGMIIFIIASGLTLIFGLMDVLNFGHGLFIALGAFVAMSVLAPMAALTTADSIPLNLVAIGIDRKSVV